MKIALYIEDGLEQIVLTPQGKVERDILGKLHDGSRSLRIERGCFYECRGGWLRHGYLSSATYGRSDDESTMIVLRPCDSGSDPQGEDSRSEAECEASQSGVSDSERIAQPSPEPHP